MLESRAYVGHIGRGGPRVVRSIGSIESTRFRTAQGKFMLC